MGWELPCDGNVNHAAICAKEEGSFCAKCEFHHPFDLNDAGLCVQETQKRGEFIPFVNSVCYSRLTDYIRINFIAWLFNADNFFKAFTEWRKAK